MRNKVLLQCFYIYCQVLSWLIISCGHYEAGNNPVKLEALIPAVRATEGAPRRGSDRIPQLTPDTSKGLKCELFSGQTSCRIKSAAES